MRTLSALVSSLALTLAACGTVPRPAPPKVELKAGILMLDGVQAAELVAAQSVFDHTRVECPPGLRVLTVGRTTDPVNSAENLVLTPQYSLADAPEFDILVVPGSIHGADRDLEDPALIEWLAARGEEADAILGLSNGCFLLAQSGLLNNRTCTISPADLSAFQSRYKGLDIRRHQVFVADGSRVTGIGGASSYDAALWLVDAIYGADAANAVARSLTLSWAPSRIPHVQVAR